MNLDQLDKALESKIRLGIMSILSVNDSMDFVSLKSLLRVTDGNLVTHLRTLENVGYIVTRKQFLDRKPNTSFSATPQGQRAFRKHLEALEAIITLHKE